MQSRYRTRGIHAVICVVATLLLASSADARQFRMTGHWVQQLGANFAIPIFGGIDNAPNQIASATGSAPATITIPVNAFTDPINTFVAPIPLTTLVQISTMFSHFGPSQPGVLVSGTKTTRPANFAFCPGAAANPACTGPATGGGQGTKHGFISYTAGPNHFGGTMRMLSGGIGAVSNLLGTSPTRIVHNPVGNPTGVPVGAPYSAMFTTVFAGGPITTGGVCAGGPCVTNGPIIANGPQTATGSSTTNIQTAFPFTTGMITVRVTDGLPTSTGTFTGTGSDNRTALGAGNVTLVAGGLLQRVSVNDTTPEWSVVNLTFKPKNLPSVSPPGLAALGALLTVGAGYALRRRMR